MQIVRSFLQDQVRRQVLDRILRAELREGAPIREEALARDIGVSRTPLREALFHLAREGFVDVHPGRGFSVRSLTLEQAAEIYPIVGALESAALAMGAPKAAALVPRLREINAALASASSATERVGFDVDWHAAIVGAAANAHLGRLMASLWDMIRRYELAYMRETVHIKSSTAEHDRIAERLEMVDVEGARDLLAAHWRDGFERVKRRMQEAAAPA